MRRSFIALLFLMLAAPLGAATAETPEFKLPAPPPGFTWYVSKLGIGSFLLPDGWHVKEEDHGETRALFISREDIDVNGRFVVGLTVNQTVSWSRSHKTKPSKSARSYAADVQRSAKVIKAGVLKGNSADMNIVRIKGDNNGVSTIVHHISIGMDDKDTFYLLIFEAPESEWEEQMQQGGQMLNFFFLGA